MIADDAAKSMMKRLRAFLSPYGFRRKGQTLIAQREDVFQLVNLQRSVGSKKDLLIVTLNLGIYSIPLAEKEREAGLFVPSMGIWSCHWRKRIGSLMPEHNDKWWRLTCEEDIGRVEAELIHALEHYGLPALARVESTAQFRALWEANRSQGQAGYQGKTYLELLDGVYSPQSPYIVI